MLFPLLGKLLWLLLQGILIFCNFYPYKDNILHLPYYDSCPLLQYYSQDMVVNNMNLGSLSFSSACTIKLIQLYN